MHFRDFTGQTYEFTTRDQFRAVDRSFRLRAKWEAAALLDAEPPRKNRNRLVLWRRFCGGGAGGHAYRRALVRRARAILLAEKLREGWDRATAENFATWGTIYLFFDGLPMAAVVMS